MNIKELLEELKSLKKEAENTADKLQLLINKLEKENLDEVTLDEKTKKVIEQAVREEIQKQKIKAPWSTDPFPNIEIPNHPYVGGTGVPSWYGDERPKIYGVGPLNPPPLEPDTVCSADGLTKKDVK